MIPYYLLMLVPLMYYIFSQKGMLKINNLNKTRQSTITIVMFFLIFFLILSLRDVTCGVDLHNYLYYFKRDARTPVRELLSKNIEVLFTLFNVSFSKFSDDFQLYLTVVAAICLLPYALFYINEAELPYYSILLFVIFAPFPLFFSGLRQSMALAFVPAAYYYCKKNNIVAFLLSVLLAFGFHQSAIIMLLMYPIYRAKITKKWAYFVIPLVLLVFVFNEQIFTFAIKFVGTKYAERYGATYSTGAYTTLIVLFVFSVFSIIIPDEKEVEETVNGLRNILFLSTSLQCFASINAIAMRMNYYFLPFVPLAVSAIIIRSKKQYKQISFMFCICSSIAFLFYFFYNAYNGNDILQIYPYVPFWRSY